MKVDILGKVFSFVWKQTEKGDNARMAKLPLPDGVCEDNNHSYIDDGTWQHKIDVYYPENFSGKLPVVVDIHGGGWMYGSKELNKPYCLYLAAKGCVVFNMSYRLVPDVGMADQLYDVSHAFKWIYENLDNYPCDKSRIYLTGDSAGGQLSSFAAVLSQTPTLAEKFGFVSSGLRFAAVCLTSPVCYMAPDGPMSIYTKYTLGKDYKTAAYKDYLNFDSLLTIGTMPPTVLVTSSGDFLARKQTNMAYNALRAKGITAKLYDWEKTDGKHLPHVFAVIAPESKEGQKAINDMFNFFAQFSADKVAET